MHECLTSADMSEHGVTLKWNGIKHMEPRCRLIMKCLLMLCFPDICRTGDRLVRKECVCAKNVCAQRERICANDVGYPLRQNTSSIDIEHIRTCRCERMCSLCNQNIHNFPGNTESRSRDSCAFNRHATAAPHNSLGSQFILY